MSQFNESFISGAPTSRDWHAEVNRLADETIEAGRRSEPQLPRLDEKRLQKQRRRIRGTLGNFQ